jgi:hypothetical protein
MRSLSSLPVLTDDQSCGRTGRPNKVPARRFGSEDGSLCGASVSKREKNLAIVSHRLIRDENNDIGAGLENRC